MSIHTSVLLEEAINALEIKPEGIYIDGTFGRGGHSKYILNKLNSNGKLIAFDKDYDAVKYAIDNISDSRFSIINKDFAEIEQSIEELNLINKIDGILLDLGVSSPQLDDAIRGFSFVRNGPLDMRMDCNSGITAREWLLSADEKEISKVLWEYGEEKFSRQIARLIVKERSININNKDFLSSTHNLVEIIDRAVPFKVKNKHPATRTFQAIRIHINSELASLKIILESAKNILNNNGRICIITFHSLEDRIVKQFFRKEFKGKDIPKGLILREDQWNKEIFFKKIDSVVKPSKDEIEHNVRSRSAILRSATRSNYNLKSYPE